MEIDSHVIPTSVMESYIFYLFLKSWILGYKMDGFKVLKNHRRLFD